MMSPMTTLPRTDALAPPVPVWNELRDALDALGDGALTEESCAEHLRPLFSRALERPGVYLAHHAHGRPLDRAAVDIAAALDLWYTGTDDARAAWMEAQSAYRAAVARLIGAPTDGCIVPKSNAGQGLRAVLNSTAVRRPNVISTRCESDAIDTILKTYAGRDRASVAWVEPREGGLLHADDVRRSISYATDIVMISHVYFSTGQALEGIEDIVRSAHHNHAVVVLDTRHSAGVVPIDLAALGVDYAIGSNSRYTRGGPGACWLMVHPRRSTGDRPHRTLDTGSFALKNALGHARLDTPEYADGADGWLESTPPFLLPYQALAGLAFTLGVGVDRLRAYGEEQLARLDAALEREGVGTLGRAGRGGFLCVPHEDAPAISARLDQDHALATDARDGCVRLGPDVLTTRAEMDEAARLMGSVIRGR